MKTKQYFKDTAAQHSKTYKVYAGSTELLCLGYGDSSHDNLLDTLLKLFPDSMLTNDDIWSIGNDNSYHTGYVGANDDFAYYLTAKKWYELFGELEEQETIVDDEVAEVLPHLAKLYSSLTEKMKVMEDDMESEKVAYNKIMMQKRAEYKILSEQRVAVLQFRDKLS